MVEAAHYPKEGQEYQCQQDGSVKAHGTVDGVSVTVDMCIPVNDPAYANEECRVCGIPGRNARWMIGFFFACDACHDAYLAKLKKQPGVK